VGLGSKKLFCGYFRNFWLDVHVFNFGCTWKPDVPYLGLFPEIAWKGPYWFGYVMYLYSSKNYDSLLNVFTCNLVKALALYLSNSRLLVLIIVDFFLLKTFHHKFYINSVLFPILFPVGTYFLGNPGPNGTFSSSSSL